MLALHFPAIPEFELKTYLYSDVISINTVTIKLCNSFVGLILVDHVNKSKVFENITLSNLSIFLKKGPDLVWSGLWIEITKEYLDSHGWSNPSVEFSQELINCWLADKE